MVFVNWFRVTLRFGVCNASMLQHNHPPIKETRHTALHLKLTKYTTFTFICYINFIAFSPPNATQYNRLTRHRASASLTPEIESL